MAEHVSDEEKSTLSPPLPSRIGRYEIKRLLGEGAMGRVYLAHDPSLHRDVALKTLRPVELSKAARERFLKRFENEARAAAGLVHPHIIQVYDVGSEEPVGPFLVFEYVEGETLRSRLGREGAMDTSTALDRLEPLAEAIDTAHAAGILHRDIKPENILVTGSGELKLADFGIARVPNASLTREGQFLGTPAYAAPETLGHGQWSAQSDLFSLACVAFEMLTGRRAFLGSGAVEVANAIIHGAPPKPSVARPGAGLSGLDAVFDRALSKAPKHRFGSAKELVQALREKGVSRKASRSTKPPSLVGPGVVVMIGGALISMALVAQCDAPAVSGLDSGVEQDASEPAFTLDAGSLEDSAIEATRDASRGVSTLGMSLDATPDAEVDAEPEALTGHEREEIAKDALAEARRALGSGDIEAASVALQRAEEYDPGNGDIAPLRRRVEVAQDNGQSEQEMPEESEADIPNDGAEAVVAEELTQPEA